jgi:hypothetical protein
VLRIPGMSEDIPDNDFILRTQLAGLWVIVPGRVAVPLTLECHPLTLTSHFPGDAVALLCPGRERDSQMRESPRERFRAALPVTSHARARYQTRYPLPVLRPGVRLQTDACTQGRKIRL